MSVTVGKYRNQEILMKTSSINTGKTLRTLGLVIALGALPLLLGVTGCTTGSRYHQSTGEYIDDHTLSSAVKKALGNDVQYKYPDVNVVTFKGVVQLSGFAATKEQKSRAGEVAKTVDGVREVENNITIKQ